MSYHDQFRPTYGGQDDGRSNRSPHISTFSREWGHAGGPTVGMQQLCPGCGVNISSHYCPHCYPDNMLLMLCGQCAYAHVHPMRPLSLANTRGDDSPKYPQHHQHQHPPPQHHQHQQHEEEEVVDKSKRNSFHVLEMECPHAKVASVIGTRGVVVKEINRRTGCFISINQAFPDGHPRTITLKGIYENVMKAKKMILSVIEHGPTALDPQKSFALGLAGSDQGSGSTMKPSGVSISVPCPLDRVGLVIGTRGAVIKEIIRRCNAHIFVAEETLIVGSEVCRMIEISGTEKEVETGKQLVHVVLQHGPNAMDAVTSPTSPPPGTSSSNSGGSSHGSKGFLGYNAPEFVPGADKFQNRPPSINLTGSNSSGFNSGHTTPTGSNLGMSSSASGSPSHAEHKVEVECPFEKVGVLIGFRGVVVKDIMHRSNTAISLSEDHAGGFSRLVEIRGSRASVTHAKILVQAVIEFGAAALTEELSVLTRAINEKNTRRAVPKQSTEIHRIEFPEEKIGLMIGSKGSMVKQIMSISGTKILISDRRSDADNSARIVEIKGDADSIGVAKTLIESLIDLEPHFQTVGSKNNSQLDHSPTDQCLEMTLPAEKVGILIGAKGFVIKEIMRISGARVSINADYTDENIRIVLIRGTREAIVDAQSIMVDVLKNGCGRLFPGEHSPPHSSFGSSAETSVDSSSMKSWPPREDNSSERAVKGYPRSGMHSAPVAGNFSRMFATGGRGGMRMSPSPLGSFSELDSPNDGLLSSSIDFGGERPQRSPAPASNRGGMRLPRPPGYDKGDDVNTAYCRAFSSEDTLGSSISALTGDTPGSGVSPFSHYRMMEFEAGLFSYGSGADKKMVSVKDLSPTAASAEADKHWDKILSEHGGTELWESSAASNCSDGGKTDNSGSTHFEGLLRRSSAATDALSWTATNGIAGLHLDTENHAPSTTESMLLNYSFLSQYEDTGESTPPRLSDCSSTQSNTDAAGNTNGADISINIPCPLDKLGQVIGSRGSVIKEIGRRSGAAVSVQKTSAESGDKELIGHVTVSGSTPESVEAARKLVLSVLEVGPSVALDGVVCFKKISPKSTGSASDSGESRGSNHGQNLKTKGTHRVA